MQKTGLVDRHDPGFERRDRLAVEKLALDAEFGEQRLFLLGGVRRVVAPGLEPAGLANAISRAGFYDPIAMQFERRADQAMQRRSARLGARGHGVAEKARDPIEGAHHP